MKNKKLVETIERLESELKKAKEELAKPKIGIESWEELDKLNQYTVSINSEVIALQKLIHLADSKHYNGAPQSEWCDWKDIFQTKYCIECHEGEIVKNEYSLSFQHLAFKTEEIRDVFYDNHLDLIEKAYGL